MVAASISVLASERVVQSKTEQCGPKRSAATQPLLLLRRQRRWRRNGRQHTHIDGPAENTEQKTTPLLTATHCRRALRTQQQSTLASCLCSELLKTKGNAS